MRSQQCARRIAGCASTKSGEARHGRARSGKARQGKGCKCSGFSGVPLFPVRWHQSLVARIGEARRGMAWHGQARTGPAGRGKGCQYSRRPIGNGGPPRALTHGDEKPNTMKQATYTVHGTTPLLMHSERLADPFDPLTVELKTLTKLRNKTQDDLLEIARLEWLGGLYHDETGIFLPGYNVLAALVGGGKMRKLGTAIKRGAIVQEDKVPVEYTGPKNPDELFKNKSFVDIRSVKVGTAKVTRCRPKFTDWKITFTLLYANDTLQKSDLDLVVQDTGAMIGIGDYRPRFGRFEVVR